MKFKVISYVKKPDFKNWEGAVIEEVSTGKKYITNGFYKWDASKERLATCEEVESIDIDKFMARWNRKFFNGELETSRG